MAGELGGTIIIVIVLSVLLLAIANFTGGVVAGFGVAPTNVTTNSSAHDLSYLSMIANATSVTSSLETKLVNSNSSSQLPLTSALGFVSAIGFDSVKTLLAGPGILMFMFGGMAQELETIIPGSSKYIAPLILIFALLAVLTVLSVLLLRGEI